MKKIESKEYKKIILDILKYFDKICRDNNIKYTLIGGSLIGAIREKGIIPWDDDIDVILDKKSFDKLSKVLSKDNHKYYKLFNHKIKNEYPITYSKIIDTRTTIYEPNAIKIDNYGAFIDIFVNYNMSKNKFIRALQYHKLHILQSLINGTLFNDKYYNNEKVLKKIRTFLGRKIGNDKLQKIYYKTITKYSEEKTNYVIYDYISQKKNKSIISSDYFNDYIDVEFEDMKVMVMKNYDEYLKILFGDYMTPPPIEKRVCHNIDAYWKE